MTRRLVLIAGLVFLGFALIGVLMMPQGGLRTGFRPDSLSLPGSLTPAPEPAPIVVGSAGSFGGNIASAPPWLTMIMLFFIIAAAVGGALLAARLRGKSAAEIGRQTAKAVGGAAVVAAPLLVLGLIACLGGCAVLGYLFFGQQMIGGTTAPMRGPSDGELTAYALGTQPAGPTLSPNEMTNYAVMAQINQTATTAFQTMSAPTILPPETPTPAGPAITPTVVGGPPQPLDLNIDWPQQIDAGDTSVVRVSIDYPVYSPESARHTSPPDGPFADPFGSAYAGMLEVTLTGDGFTITPAEPIGPLPLSQRYGLNWGWTVSPDPSINGPQTLHVVISGDWEPAPGTQGQPFRQVLARRDLIVNVAHPAAPAPTLRLLALAAALIGAGLCAPWLYGHFRAG